MSIQTNDPIPVLKPTCRRCYSTDTVSIANNYNKVKEIKATVDNQYLASVPLEAFLCNHCGNLFIR